MGDSLWMGEEIFIVVNKAVSMIESCRLNMCLCIFFGLVSRVCSFYFFSFVLIAR